MDIKGKWLDKIGSDACGIEHAALNRDIRICHRSIISSLLAPDHFFGPFIEGGASPPSGFCSFGCMQEQSITLPGLDARLDKLCHHNGGLCMPADKPHAFVYFITITNQSDHAVTLLGRKWVIENIDGTIQIIEGDRIVGEIPRLAPGESFSYNSCHMTACEAVAKGCFHGIDDIGRRIHVSLPAFALRFQEPQQTPGVA